MPTKYCPKQIYAWPKELYDSMYQAYSDKEKEYNDRVNSAKKTGDIPPWRPIMYMPIKYKTCPKCNGTGKIEYNKPSFRAK